MKAGLAPSPLPRADDSGSGVPAGGRFFSFAPTGFRGLSRAFWALEIYLFLSTSVIDEEWEAVGNFHPRLILGSLVLLVVLIRAFDRKLHPEGFSPADPRPARWLLAFVAAGLVSTVWAYIPELAWSATTGQLVNLTRVLAFFLVVGIVRTRREIMITVLVLAAGCGFYLLRSVSEYAAGKYQFTMGVKRMMGAGHSYEEPNGFAATLVLAFPLILWAAVRTRSRLLALCALAYGGLGAVSVVLTHSRSGLVLLLLAAAWAFFTLPRHWMRAGLLAALVAMGAVLAANMTENELQRFAGLTTTETLDKDESAHGRIEGYEVSWKIFLDHPVIGIGPGCWPKYRAQRIDGNEHEPHNLPGQLISTRGIIGTVTFLGFLGTVIALAIRERRRRRAGNDPWDDAVRGLAATTLFTFFLLFVSGLGAHNLERPSWYLLPALFFAAAACRDESPRGNGVPARGREAVARVFR